MGKISTAGLISVVGPCGAGKTTLINGLKRRGYNARHIAQDHSYVADMWKRLTNPKLLIFLQAAYPVTCQRRKLSWTEAEYAEEQRRLAHAYKHADICVNTDDLTIEEVLTQVIGFIENME